MKESCSIFKKTGKQREEEGNKNQTNFYICLYIYRSYQDGSLIFVVRMGDVMDLICPFYDEQQSYMTSELEQYDIYRVCFILFFY